MKRVYDAQNFSDAHLLKDILDTQGIEAIIKGDSILWVAPVGVRDSPSVWVVDDEDYEEAMEVVSEYSSKGVTGKRIDKKWKCKKCGEISEEQFSECWKCGAKRSQGRKE